MAAQELVLKEIFEEVAPGVYSVQLLDLSKVWIIREWFDAAAESGIPIRPPYGIVLNRKGFMVDPRSVGYWAAPDFQHFYKDVLIDSYVRPMSRLFFPDSIVATDDSESFAFSIQYQVGGDESIRHHTDASTITFNINLDAEKVWSGSSLYFWESLSGGILYTVDWLPGKAVMHLDRTLHVALPIESGIRNSNVIVVWTMGEDGGRGYGGGSAVTTEDGKYHEDYQLSREERWTKSVGPAKKAWDRWSPF
ncbi:MAG: 2OG-Fe(II) oxygenase [Myxococcota bacterium]